MPRSHAVLPERDVGPSLEPQRWEVGHAEYTEAAVRPSRQLLEVRQRLVAASGWCGGRDGAASEIS